MPLIRNAAALAALLPPSGGLLALDVSKNRIGFAGTDPGRRLVTPLLTWTRRPGDADLKAVAKVAQDRKAVALVVGWPLNMDGSEGPQCRLVQAFAKPLDQALRLPLLLQDERLTTQAVTDAIEEGRLPRPKKGALIDHYAAAVILEDALAGLARAMSAG